MIQILRQVTLVTALGLAALTGCTSSVKKADIPATANPETEITKFEEMINTAITQNVDVLAPSDFKESRELLKEAKSDLASSQEQEEILNDVRLGRGYLAKAQATAETRKNLAPGIFESRQLAFQAGAMEKPELKSTFKELDSDLGDKADSLAKMSASDLSQFQKQYVDLERRAVVLTQLGGSQALLNGAKKEDGTSKAPTVYKKTELALKNAESMINTNVRNPMGFQKSVMDANAQATQLNQVMLMIKQNKNLSEGSALKMVAQNTQIKKLKNDLTDSEFSNSQLSIELKSSVTDLDQAQASVEMQKALEQARSKFSSDEAEAYQQGGNLVIRMKNMNFSSGRSELPANSLASLSKVMAVAKSLSPGSIQVEGHTDSTGTETANMQISEARAKAVATYFKSNGSASPQNWDGSTSATNAILVARGVKVDHDLPPIVNMSSIDVILNSNRKLNPAGLGLISVCPAENYVDSTTLSIYDWGNASNGSIRRGINAGTRDGVIDRLSTRQLYDRFVTGLTNNTVVVAPATTSADQDVIQAVYEDYKVTRDNPRISKLDKLNLENFMSLVSDIMKNVSAAPPPAPVTRTVLFFYKWNEISEFTSSV